MDNFQFDRELCLRTDCPPAHDLNIFQGDLSADALDDDSAHEADTNSALDERLKEWSSTHSSAWDPAQTLQSGEDAAAIRLY